MDDQRREEPEVTARLASLAADIFLLDEANDGYPPASDEWKKLVAAAVAAAGTAYHAVRYAAHGGELLALTTQVRERDAALVEHADSREALRVFVSRVAGGYFGEATPALRDAARAALAAAVASRNGDVGAHREAIGLLTDLDALTSRVRAFLDREVHR